MSIRWLCLVSLVLRLLRVASERLLARAYEESWMSILLFMTLVGLLIASVRVHGVDVQV